MLSQSPLLFLYSGPEVDGCNKTGAFREGKELVTCSFMPPYKKSVE